MKKTITLAVLLIQFSFAFAQNQQITKFWGNPSKGENVVDFFQINNHTYFASVFRDYNIGAIPTECILLKIDSSLNVTDSLNLLNYSKKGFIYRLNMFFNYNNRLMSYGFAYDTINFKSRLWISEFTDNLDILYDTVYENPDTIVSIYNSKLLISSENKLLFTAQYYPFFQDSNNTEVILIDSNFNITLRNRFNTCNGTEGLSAVEVPATQSFHIITQNEITKINSNDLSNDTVIWKVEDAFSQWMFIRGALAINDSSYLHPRRYIFSNNNNQTLICSYYYIRDKKGNIKDSVFVGNSQKSYCQNSNDNILIYSKDSVLATGMNYSPDSNFASNEYNTIYLWSFSVNGNINWQRYYFASGLKLLVNDICKTSDGGCVLTGFAWDWQINPFYNSDIFFLKLDKNGNIIGSQGINEIITQSEILVYPNPASEIINFDIGMFKDFQLLIYNQLGQVVLEDKLTQGNNTINISNLKKGIYFYKLQNTNEKTISGKFVKE